MKDITKAYKIIQKVGSNGKMFGVTFIKKDGSTRDMNCRLNVKKHLRGGGYNTVAHIPEYLTVYSMDAKGYRNVNLSTVKEIRGSGRTIKL